MTYLSDLIAPGRKDVVVRFPAEQKVMTTGEMWRSTGVIAGWLKTHGTSPVAMLLSNSAACVSVLVGAVAAGVRVVSLPPPPRSADVVWYTRFIVASCRQVGASVLVVDAPILAMLPPLPGIVSSSFDQILSQGRTGPLCPERFTLTQFTSGSTTDPKGVVLDQKKIIANIKAILHWLEPNPGDSGCSWLPLSHDMGLIGMFLTVLVAGGSDWCNGTELVLLTPEMFLHDPASWLDACSEYASTVTSAPNFGFEMAMRRRRAGPLDLSRLRVCITGAEPVRAVTLTKFAEAFGPCGFRRWALSPAYGLAECVLAVTGTPPPSDWGSLSLDPAALADGRIVEDDQGVPVVSSGQPLRGFTVVSDSDSEIGDIAVSGPSVADVYSDGSLIADRSGRFATGDLGFLRDGDLYVIGRRDDVFSVAGRNVYAIDIEGHVGGVAGVRQGRVVALLGEEGELCVVAEHDGIDVETPEATRRLVGAVRARVRERVGTNPRRVVIVPRGHLPMTSSGKMQRARVRKAMAEGSLPALPGSTM